MFGLIIWLSLTPGILSATVHIYVSPQGSDSNDGRSSLHPYKTLQKAVDGLNQYHSDVVYVEMMKGYYDLPSTLKISGSFKQPVTFRSYQNQEVHVTGGRRIESKLFKPVTDPHILQRIPQEAHGKVRQVHLPDAHITNYGKMTAYGFYSRRTAPLEVTINGVPLRLAEWPNRNFINIASVPDGRRGLRFGYNTNRDSRWVGEKDPWVYGYWFYSWADHSAQVAKFDVHSHEITVTKGTNYGFRTGHLRPDHNNRVGNDDQGGYFRVINMLSELDQPGEYYLDRSTGIMYLWPNTNSQVLHDSDVVYASIIDDCISLGDGTQNIIFEGFTLESCRHFGLTTESVQNIKIRNLEVRNMGSYGISLGGDSRYNLVANSDIHDCDGGIKISGGDRKTLTSSGNIIENNQIWQFGRATQVGADGIAMSGVNHVIKNNHIHHGTYACIHWYGNDHIIEYNEIHDCCHNSTDCGAIHSGRDWTMRGTVVRYNYIHDMVRRWPGGEIRGVMLDDQFSSITVERNVFFSNEVHNNIGGGRDNVIRYNVFYTAGVCLDVDGRGITSNSNRDTLEGSLKKVPYTNSLWTSRYPKLAAMAHSNVQEHMQPIGNDIHHNIFYTVSPTKKLINYHGSTLATSRYFNLHDNFHTSSTSNFYSPEHRNFELRCAARTWANTHNFPQPVSYDKVGPIGPYGPHYVNKGLKVTNKVFSQITTGSCTGH